VKGTTVSLATFARIAFYGDGNLDPSTATCDRHQLAAPFSDVAKGDGAPIDGAFTVECTVCPLPDSDLIGAVVLTYFDSKPVLYGGDYADGWSSLKFGIGTGGLPVRSCGVTKVMPADRPVSTADSRVTIEKMPKKRDYQDSGPWLLHLPGLDGRTRRGYKTKRDAVADGLLRLAIDDYWAERGQQVSTVVEIGQPA
jgi:hypothetical protein